MFIINKKIKIVLKRLFSQTTTTNIFYHGLVFGYSGWHFAFNRGNLLIDLTFSFIFPNPTHKVNNKTLKS